MKNCNDCYKKLEQYLCDVPSKWREQIITVICDHLESQSFPCKDIITCFNDEMDTLDPKCLTVTVQQWQVLSWYDKMQLIIDKICSILNVNSLVLNDSWSISLSGQGSDISPLEANIILSDDPGHDDDIEIRANGIFFPKREYTSDRGVEKNTEFNFRITDIEDFPGKHFLWNYDKGAFRVGETTGTQWDNSSIGIGSSAFGKNTKVSGDFAGAFGETNTIENTGDWAFTTGKNNAANQPYSAVFGLGHSVMVQDGTSGSEGSSFTAGIANQISSGLGYAIGANNEVNGNYSGILGYNSLVGARWSHLIGEGLVNHADEFNEVENHIIVGNYNNLILPEDIDSLGEGDSNTEKVVFTIGGGYRIENPDPTPDTIVRTDVLKVYKTGTIKLYGGIDQRTSTRGILSAQWTTLNRPVAELGEMGFNTTLGSMEYWNGLTWIQF